MGSKVALLQDLLRQAVLLPGRNGRKKEKRPAWSHVEVSWAGLWIRVRELEAH